MTAIATPADPATDTELFDRARAGDRSVLEILWKRHYPYALTVARCFTSNAFDADDLASEAFTRMVAILRAGRGPRDHGRTYLARTVRNVATDRARRQTVVSAPLEQAEDLPARDDPAHEVAMVLELTETLGWLAECSPRQRYALWMTASNGRSVDGVADDLGISTDAAAQLITRARRSIQQRHQVIHS